MDILSNENGNIELGKMIENGGSMSVIRLRAESDVLIHQQQNNYPYDIHIRYQVNGGLYPLNLNTLKSYAQHVKEGIINSNMMIYWESLKEQYISSNLIKKNILSSNRAVEPFYFQNPWSQYLEGKKVLVIHPFTDSIEKQYKLRDKLFQNKKILPLFDLKTYKSIQTSTNITKPHNTWEESLNKMKNDITEIDFDIALIGCGCYDIPLSTHIKKLNKQSIIVGGGLQILFGIKGKRWDEHNYVSKLYNEYWIRPSTDEKPKGFSSVENGCYW